MTAPDLTPDEARAEVEAFLGPGWKIVIDDDGETFAYVLRAFNSYVGVEVPSDTLRAAVSALKQAWRDAVRPGGAGCKRNARDGGSAWGRLLEVARNARGSHRPRAQGGRQVTKPSVFACEREVLKYAAKWANSASLVTENKLYEAVREWQARVEEESK